MKILTPGSRRLMRLLAIPALLVFLLTGIAVLRGTIALSYSSMAVDAEGRLYLGRGDRIEIYEAGTRTASIAPKAGKSYLFTLQGEELVLSTGKTVITLDLQGNGIDQQPDENGTVYQQLKAQKGTFTAADGTVYTLRHEMLATEVTAQDGTVLYAEPGWSNVLKPLLALAALYVVFAAGYVALDRFAKLAANGGLEQA